MDSVLRAAMVYVILMVLFNIAGKRTISQAGTFDFVVLLIIGEAVQGALIGDNPSFMNMLLVVITLLGLSIMVSVRKRNSDKLENVMGGGPLVLLHDGPPYPERMRLTRVDIGDIMLATRETQGLERLEQIKYAVLEDSGNISVIPKEKS